MVNILFWLQYIQWKNNANHVTEFNQRKNTSQLRGNLPIIVLRIFMSHKMKIMTKSLIDTQDHIQ